MEPAPIAIAVVQHADRFLIGRVHLHFLAATPVDPAAEPKRPFRWVPAGELGQYEFPAANVDLVAFLSSRANNS